MPLAPNEDKLLMTMNARYVSENLLLEGIQAGGQQRRRFETVLYNRYVYLIQAGVRRHRLNQDECSSAYSDTILSIVHQIAHGRFEQRATVKTYLYQIFTNKCVDLVRSNLTHRSSVHNAGSLDDALLELPDPARSAVQRLIDQYDVNELQQRLRVLGQKNQEMILAWGEGYSDGEIAQKVGYKSAAVAKTSRLRCLKQLRALTAITK